MKKNVTPELSPKWWDVNQPGGLSSADAFGKALQAWSTASAKADKERSAAALDACAKALTQVEALGKKLQDEAAKAAKSPPPKSKSTPEDYLNTAEAFKKLPKVVQQAQAALPKPVAEDEGGEDEDEASGNVLEDPEAYTRLLKTAFTKLRAAPMQFGVGLGKLPEDHRLLMHASKSGKSLAMQIKKLKTIRKTTWGVAEVGKDAGSVTLTLEGPNLGGIKRLLELFLRKYRVGYGKVTVLLQGKEIDDEPEDDDAPAGGQQPSPPSSSSNTGAPGAPLDAAQLIDALKKLTPAIQSAVTADPSRKLAFSQAVALFNGHAKSNRLAEARQALSAIAALLKQAPGSGGSAKPGGDKAWVASRQAWQQASELVDSQITALQAVLKQSDDEELVEIGEFGLNAVTGNYKVPLMAAMREIDADPAKAEPALVGKARRIVAEFRKHIDADDRITVCDENPFGVPVKIRATLGPALAQIDAALAQLA